MAQDPKKEAKEIERTSLKDKLKQVSQEKKAPLKKATEMGKPSLMPKFEAAMQKERDFVLNRAKERDKDPDWYKKEAIMQKEKSGIFDAFKPSMVKDIERYKKPLKSMSKNKLKY